jgi:diguanylate cyclase (GGDEF)-like protein
MPHASTLNLDLPTLTIVAVGLAGLLGVFLIICWLQEKSVRALAWWGSAYLIGAGSIGLWVAPRAQMPVPPEIPEALTLLACGVIWSGIRLFHDRRIEPTGTFAGALLWPALCQFPAFAEGTEARLALGAVLVAAYTFAIAFELWRERRRTLFSRTAGFVVPSLHAAIFLAPMALQVALPQRSASEWLAVFALEAMLYSVGTAFIVLLMVKDHHLQVYRHAASTDPLTGLFNRRAFMENARALCARQAAKRQAVSLLMFDLDHFKSINDRFGHATGDEVLRVFAQVLRRSMRANDIVGRLGGEEFAAIVPGDNTVAASIGERIRAGFELAAVTVAGYEIGGTVSIGTTAASAPVTELDGLINCADAALYEAKHAGRNRICSAEFEAPPLVPAQSADALVPPAARRSAMAEQGAHP